ncbi:MAG TPA: hypothetical protein VD833_11090 [Vicinamibacterales bacterium]|nr:hypothetical protein [Vicinamibacterales bacterium]
MTQPADLERLVHAHVRGLPPPPAPQTLLPRVMAAVASWAARPWYKRAWFTWPAAGQFVTVVTLLALTIGLLGLLPVVARPFVESLADALADGQAELAMLVAYARVTSETAAGLWRAVIGPFVSYASTLVLLMTLACGLFGAALNHAVVGRMSAE